MYIAGYMQEVALIEYHRCLVYTLKKWTDPLIFFIEIHSIRRHDLLKTLFERLRIVVYVEQQMVVISHKAIAKQFKIVEVLIGFSIVTDIFSARIKMTSKNIEKFLFISRVKENWLLRHTPVVYVVVMVRHENLTRIFGGHVRTIRPCHAAVNQMTRFYNCEGRALQLTNISHFLKSTSPIRRSWSC